MVDIKRFFDNLTKKLGKLILKNILCTLCLGVGRFQGNPVFCFKCTVLTHINNFLKLALHVLSYFHALTFEEVQRVRVVLVATLSGGDKWICWRSGLLEGLGRRRNYFFYVNIQTVISLFFPKTSLILLRWHWK